MPLNIMKEQSFTYTKTTFALFDYNLRSYGQLFVLVLFCMILSFFTTTVLWQPMEVLKQVFNDYLTNST